MTSRAYRNASEILSQLKKGRNDFQPGNVKIPHGGTLDLDLEG